MSEAHLSEEIDGRISVVQNSWKQITELQARAKNALRQAEQELGQLEAMLQRFRDNGISFNRKDAQMALQEWGTAMQDIKQLLNSADFTWESYDENRRRMEQLAVDASAMRDKIERRYDLVRNINQEITDLRQDIDAMKQDLERQGRVYRITFQSLYVALENIRLSTPERLKQSISLPVIDPQTA